jgi:transaldolase
MLAVNLRRMAQAGQSVWYDNVSRELLRDGTIRQLIDEGIAGLTSNPSIFEKAITGSTVYDVGISSFAEQLSKNTNSLTAGVHGAQADGLIEYLMADDIRSVCELLMPLYEKSAAQDGYASIEVSPLLALDAEGTIKAAKELYDQVDCPNVMIKIPATEECLPAIEEVLFQGISVNVTLIFSEERYRQVAARFLSAIDRRLSKGLDCSRIASVASFFVSRVDSACDAIIDQSPVLVPLRGQMALANCICAYQAFTDLFLNTEQLALQNAGRCQLQRPLWASTSTKDPKFHPLKYLRSLCLPHTVNTIPPATADALRSEALGELASWQGAAQAKATLQAFNQGGGNFDQVLSTLLDEGVHAFSKSFDTLRAGIEQRLSSVLQKGNR